MENYEETNHNSNETKLSKVRTDDWGMHPRNMGDAMKLCEFIAKSQVVPQSYRGKPSDIFVCINYGKEVGLQPLQSLNSINVINGRPSLDTQSMLALARSHPEFEYILEDNEAFAYARDNVAGWEHLKDVDPNNTSICVIKREDEPVVVREFSNEDVKRAGLGNVHKTYPKDMRKYRARGRALEASFGDIFKGFKQTEVEEENVRAYGPNYEGKKSEIAGVADSIKDSMAKQGKKESKADKLNSEDVLNTDGEIEDEIEDAEIVDEGPSDEEIEEQLADCPFDLRDFTVKELRDKLDDVHTLEELNALYEFELLTQDRATAIKYIDSRIVDVAEAEDSDSTADIEAEKEAEEPEKAESVEKALYDVENGYFKKVAIREVSDGDREALQAAITKMSRVVHGNEGMAWFKKIKEYVSQIDPKSNTMLELSNDDLGALYNVFVDEYKEEVS